MKKRTLSTLKAIFGSKKGKRRHSTKPSRTPSPEPSRVSSAGSGESFRPIARTPPPARAGPPPSPPVPTCPVAPVAPEPAGPLALIPCAVCNRTFVPESLAKHVKICEKMAAKRRKTFDSSRQRREGTDLEQYLPKNFGLPENSPFLEKSPPTTDKVTPKPKPQTVRTNIMKPAADLQKCPHCGRAFGVRAFERHVEWCADKAKILPAAPAQPPPHIADAKQRLNARTQYKAPLARGRRSSQTRDKSSNSRSASVESTRGASPPPPREYGDCRNRRARASESVSSNDCHDEPSPHVPVIRNMRTSQNSSSGDANVKARQARLARDLSTSRNSNEPNHASVQHSSTDPNLKKAQNKPVNKLSVKKQQQIKKLEEIANKYNERQAKATEEIEKKIQEKKQIPVLRRFSNKKNIPNQTVDNSCKSETAQETLIPKPSSSKIKTILPKNTTEKTQKVNQKNNLTNVKDNNTIRKREKKNKIELMKENSMSIDSLDDVAISVSEKTCQSIGINTELLCVPCVIHENFEIKHPNSSGKKKNKLSFVDNLQFSERSGKDDVSDEKLELLYKNPTMVSSCDIQAKMSSISNFIKSNDCTPDSYKDNLKSDVNPATETTDSSSTHLEPLNSDEVLRCDDNLEVVHDLSAEHFEDSYEHNVSVDNFDNSEGNKSENENDIKNSEIECRHGSGETYTKFTESPGDLEEFLNLTDKMINIQDYSQSDTALKNHIENLHTPRTNSLETINDKNVEEVDNIESKQHFSDTLEDLKSDLKELLTEAGDTIGKEVKQVDNNDELKMEVSDMEHITVYGLKFYEQKQCKEEICETDNESSKLKLPSISETNKPETKTCNKNRMKKIFKINRKYKMLGEQNRGDVDNKTFIVKKEIDESDDQSITLEAPPLKLPRIEKKRTEDTYDPFVSAARQMKELLSSESNLPKKIHNSSKDLSRTLPILRPAKDKAPASQLRPENSKLMKDTLNKTYQKTPTLQRMKSFGSTNNDNNTSTLGGRCSSFRINRNDKKMAPKLNTTFTKSSKENISIVDKTNFNRNNSLNRSFSSYTASSYNTPKLKDKIPKISTSMYHSFQRTTIKQPVKLDKINKDDEKKNFVNLDSILVDDNSSMTDSNYIDPRLINENDNLPINVNTILNNPDIISSMESLLTTENLPAKFDSFSKTQNYELNGNIELQIKTQKDKINNNSDTNKLITAPIDNLSTHYDKIMSSLEDGIASKTLTRDGESVFDDFDLEEFMTTFDEEIHKKKSDSKRICSSTTRVVRQSELAGSNRTSAFSSVSSTPKSVNPSSNGFSPITNSNSFNFSSKNVANESFLPSSIKRSTSLLDSIQKKNTTKTEGGKTRHKSDQMEIDRDLMQSLKDFDKFYESERNEICQSNKDVINYNMKVQNGTSKKDSRVKTQRRSGKSENNTNGNYTPNGKSSNDSAYSSLNRISPSKLSVCAQEPHGPPSLRQAPGSDSSGPRDEARSVSSEEFLAMERSAELEPARRTPHDDEVADKHVSSRASSRRGSWRPRAGLSSSSSEASLHAPHAPHGLPAPRPSRFCHECGSKFPVDTAKFCMECGVKRLLL